MGKDLYFTRDDAEEFCELVNSNEDSCNRMLMIRDDLERHFAIPYRHTHQTLTREDAIKRIRDIRECKQVDHIIYGITDSHSGMIGAELELMAIFDIKEEEIITLNARKPADSMP